MIRIFISAEPMGFDLIEALDDVNAENLQKIKEIFVNFHPEEVDKIWACVGGNILIDCTKSKTFLYFS
jgi:hypothetical protein